MGNLSSVSDEGDESYGRSRAERWAVAKRCVALLQVGGVVLLAFLVSAWLCHSVLVGTDVNKLVCVCVCFVGL